MKAYVNNKLVYQGPKISEEIIAEQAEVDVSLIVLEDEAEDLRLDRGNKLKKGYTTTDKKMWFNKDSLNDFTTTLNLVTGAGGTEIKWKDVNGEPIALTADESRAYAEEALTYFQSLYGL